MAEELAIKDTPARHRTLDGLIRYFVRHIERIDYRGRLERVDAIGRDVIARTA